MALSKLQKENAYKAAAEITKAYGNSAAVAMAPSVILQALYETIQKIFEDIVKAS